MRSFRDRGEGKSYPSLREAPLRIYFFLDIQVLHKQSFPLLRNGAFRPGNPIAPSGRGVIDSHLGPAHPFAVRTYGLNGLILLERNLSDSYWDLEQARLV